MNKILVLCTLLGLLILGGFLISLGGCTYLSLPTKPTTPIIPTPIEQLWNVAKQTNWLATLSILGIASGVFALMNGNKIGISATIASCVSLFMTLAVARFATWMAVCGLIGSVAICAASILLKNKAIKEIIIGVQKAKDNMIGIGGENPGKTTLKKELDKQSKSTQKLVQLIKGNLKMKGVI
jgi:hypothetical protein